MTKQPDPKQLDRQREAQAKKDRPAVEEYVALHNPKPLPNRVEEIVRRMDMLRRERPKGKWPEPTHEPLEDIESDAIRVLRGDG